MNSREKKQKKNRWLLWTVFAGLLFFALCQVVSDQFGEEEKVLRRQVRQAVTERFPDQAKKYAQTVGLFPYMKNQTVANGNKSNAVILIHGLDDPGKVWMNLAPALKKLDFPVWVMHYPNDQPVEESSQLFVKELKQLKEEGYDKISIVAHSMGGLVTRDLLTSPGLDYPQEVVDQTVPLVKKFIMVGTPNHGSHLARFRSFSEIRDQFEHMIRGDGVALGFILDGAGEAKIDLLPGSPFLTKLNSRPHPKNVDMLIIAGISIPWNKADVTRWKNILGESVAHNRTEIDTIAEAMVSMMHGLGDGLVTVESTRLEGVNHISVHGTHLSMIRNVSTTSTRIPPAVPLIISYLNEEHTP